jgi:Zn finger protein HypA/HybF involved in hydrogenase expression
MATNRETLEQKILEYAQQVVRKMLDELPESGDITLSDMEKATGVMGQALLHQTMQQLVESQQQTTVADLRCKSCDERMSRRGKRKRRIVTVRGEVEVERSYYVCPKCGTGRFPPG